MFLLTTNIKTGSVEFRISVDVYSEVYGYIKEDILVRLYLEYLEHLFGEL